MSLLLYLEDRIDRDIAEVLGITETNVATKINGRATAVGTLAPLR